MIRISGICKALVFAAMVSLTITAGVCFAGTYTITTTAEQDILLDKVAGWDGLTVQQLIEQKFAEQLMVGLQRIENERFNRIINEYQSADEAKRSVIFGAATSGQ